MERDSAGSLDGLVARTAAVVLAWDPDAAVRAETRPDGKLDLTVISRRFEGKDSREREEEFWPALHSIPKADMVHLTYCLLLTPEEAERSFGPAQPPGATDNWDDDEQ
ncbi:MAG TPA: hypothetical protein VKT77_11420 [Chthonomonadaceae bacterium]|nr:hypothetical protein [Chthonomonadaceae bacterium]